MGREIIALIHGEYAERTELGAMAASTDPLEPLLETEAIIDFAQPAAVIALCQKAETVERLPALIVGSTGWKDSEKKTLDAWARKAPVLMASNFSTGVHALSLILRQAAPVLARLGYTPVLVETHHQHKKDAPSGTALSLQKVISPESPSSVQTHSVRAGEVVGDHAVTFYGASDKITLGHFAQDRSLFARGAIDVAMWLAQTRDKQTTGKVLSMEDYFRALQSNG